MLLFCLVLLVVSWWQKRGFKEVNDLAPEILFPPQQTDVTDNRPINFEREGFRYTLTPLFDYTLNGLVLSTFTYDNWYSYKRTDKTFLKDVCLIWGDNLGHKIYQDKTLRVNQDSRFCFYRYRTPGLRFSTTEFSNNHLIASNPEIDRQIREIEPGDQVIFYGKLVNVDLEAIGQTQRFEPIQGIWKTSTVRDDTGAGACEVMYVQEVEILKKGNTLWHWIFSVSWLGVGIVALWSSVSSIWDLVMLRRGMGNYPRL